MSVGIICSVFIILELTCIILGINKKSDKTRTSENLLYMGFLFLGITAFISLVIYTEFILIVSSVLFGVVLLVMTISFYIRNKDDKQSIMFIAILIIVIDIVVGFGMLGLGVNSYAYIDEYKNNEFSYYKSEECGIFGDHDTVIYIDINKTGESFKLYVPGNSMNVIIKIFMWCVY